jgi:hypothetical protein
VDRRFLCLRWEYYGLRNTFGPSLRPKGSSRPLRPPSSSSAMAAALANLEFTCGGGPRWSREKSSSRLERSAAAAAANLELAIDAGPWSSRKLEDRSASAATAKRELVTGGGPRSSRKFDRSTSAAAANRELGTGGGGPRRSSRSLYFSRSASASFSKRLFKTGGGPALSPIPPDRSRRLLIGFSWEMTG